MRRYLIHKSKRKLLRKKSRGLDLGFTPIENITPIIRGRFDYDNVVPKSILKNNANNPAENGNKRVRFNDNVEEFPSMDLNRASYTASLNGGGLHLNDNFPENGGSSFGNLSRETRKTKKPQVSMRKIDDEIAWDVIVELNQAGIISDKLATMLYNPKVSVTYKLEVCKKFIEVKGHDNEMQPLIKYYTYKMHVLRNIYKRNSKEKYIYDSNQIIKYISGSKESIKNSILCELHNGSNEGALFIKDNIVSIISIVEGILQLKNQFKEYYDNDSELIKKVSKYAKILCSIMTQLERECAFGGGIINDMNNIIATCMSLMQI